MDYFLSYHNTTYNFFKTYIKIFEITQDSFALQDLRRDSMKKRVKERATANRLSQGYLEGGDSDDEGGVSLNALKNKYKKGGNKRGGKNKEMYLNFSLMMVLSIMIYSILNSWI